jgi:hypothetical protein
MNAIWRQKTFLSRTILELVTQICYQCHTLATAKDFIFTDYPRR